MSGKKEGVAKFSGKWGFVLSAVGSAVGMANVWGFPAKMGQNGGGAFLVAYLFFIILFSSVGLSAEYAVGRAAATGTLGAYRMAWKDRKEKEGRFGQLIGWLPLAGSLCIAIGYAVIISYVLKALVDSLVGTLMKADTAEWFSTFSSTPYSVVVFHMIVVLGTLATLLLGASSIEKTNKIFMPLFFIIFVVLAIKVSTLPGALEGYAFVFRPKWGELKNPMVWIWAMGQAFFSLSITGSGMIVYGAYLTKTEDVVATARQTAFFDTLAAIIASLVIIPACYAYHLDVGSGPALLFVTLPRILQDVSFGRVFAIILYVAMIFAGVSSLQNMFEAIAESLLNRFPGLKRRTVLICIGVLCLVIGIPMETINKWGPWMDAVSIYIIPIGAMIGAISWFWIMHKKTLLEEINQGSAKEHGNFWYYTGRFLYVPCAMILCGVALFLKVAF
ncbi:MAG: sodium-dependent transporter [Eubacteriales bacterium]|nr:sodium-dependent transporter [Eubacteriales bacterium]